MPDPEVAARVRAALNKRFKGAFADVTQETVGSIEVMPSGTIAVDFAGGVGGWPLGRMIELYGAESSGKSTLALVAAAQFQAAGRAVCYLDYEHSFDRGWAQRNGVQLDPALFLFTQPDTLEQGLAIIEAVAKSKIVGLVIVDSLAAMIPAKELEGELDDVKAGYGMNQAKEITRGLRRLTAVVADEGVVVLWINHVKEAIGQSGYGPPRKVTPGGRALKFYASMRVELSPMKSLKGATLDPLTGQKVEGRVASQIKTWFVKNKVGPPYRSASFYLTNEGVDDAMTVFELCVARKLIRPAGSRFVLPFPSPSDPTKQLSLAGRENTLNWLRGHPAEYAELRESLLARLRGESSDLSAPDLSEEEAAVPSNTFEIEFGEDEVVTADEL